tara:strand:+ start:708 stop:944 length:237 start_codon:yes stop_codon:yes gene_type:complete
MRPFAASLDVTLIRFYFMMAVVFIGLFSGYYLIAGLALPIFLATLLGLSFKKEVQKSQKVSLSPSQHVVTNDNVRLAA